MKDTKSTQSDLEILTQLNADYLASDQNGDVQRYGQILAEDFMSSCLIFAAQQEAIPGDDDRSETVYRTKGWMT